ncbi:MAG TPA: CidA/LrgA family protein [Burkholderiaceae bacterium]|nr:CidA/LrgA family protein [Burkholderiaceae bacterium]
MNSTINGLTKLLLFQFLGEGLAFVLSAPIPGPVIGMLLLFAYLVARGRRESALLEFSSGFLRHLSLLFIPASVGVMAHADLLAREWLAICIALVASTLVAIVVTAYVAQDAKHDA